MMGVLLQYRPLGVEQVKDRRLQHLIRQVDNHLKALYAYMNEIVETDPGKGIVRVTGSVRPREIGAIPSEKSTYGQVGELVTVVTPETRRLFIKKGLTREDDQWDEVLTADPGSALATFYQSTKPVAPTRPGFWWEDKGAGNPDDLWASMKHGNDAWGWVHVRTAPTTAPT